MLGLIVGRVSREIRLVSNEHCLDFFLLLRFTEQLFHHGLLVAMSERVSE